MMTREALIKKLRKESDALKADFGVKRIAIFGSFASDTQTSRSDVDVVVELDRPLGFRFFDLARKIERIVGKRADILTAEALKSIRVKEIARSIKKELRYV
jgi:predicted nucleotidyltransferase